jgi:hypothetical protein
MRLSRSTSLSGDVPATAPTPPERELLEAAAAQRSTAPLRPAFSRAGESIGALLSACAGFRRR